MRVLSRRAAEVFATLILFGCGHTIHTSVVPPTQVVGVDDVARMAAGNLAAVKSVVFAASLGKQSVVAFNGSGDVIATMRTGVGALATDPHGNLYVAPNQGSTDKLEIFAPPYTGSPRRIQIPDEIVKGVAVDQRSGVFAVLSDSAQPGGGPSRITLFKPGATTACDVVHQPQNLAVFFTGAAFDREGVLFFTAGTNSGQFPLASTGGECAAKVVQVYPFRNSLDYLTFNSDDDLVVQAYTRHGAGAIYTFAHPKNGRFGSPIATTILQPEKGYVPIFHSMSSDGRHLWADYINNDVELFDYPGGGTPIKSFPVYNAINAAVYPAVVP